MLYILLPAFNEEKALPLLLDEIYKTEIAIPFKIVVVNDGSTDLTKTVLSSYEQKHSNLKVLHHEKNKGLSRALLTGINYALTNNHEESLNNLLETEDSVHSYDILITLDSDNTHPPDRIPLMIRKVIDGADIVIASRFVEGGEQFGLGLFRRLLSWGAGKVMSFFFPIPGVKDYSCGYRAYSLPVLSRGMNFYKDSLIESSGFAGMVELLIKLAPFSREVAEIPLSLHYERKCGRSKMKILLTIKGYVELIYRCKKIAGSTLEWAEE